MCAPVTNPDLSIWRTIWRMGRLVLAGALALLVAGCFDLEHEVTIEGDGSGSVRLALITDPVLAESADFESILTAEDQNSEIREYTEDGRFIHEETVRFDTLDGLSLRDEKMQVTSSPRALFGIGPNQARFERTLSLGPQSDDDLRILERIFLDNTYTFSVTLPGWITGAEPVMVSGTEIAPERQGATTTWTIPMADLATSGDVTFRVDFVGYFGFDETTETGILEGGLGDFLGLLSDN